MAEYKLTSGANVIRTKDSASIPDDPRNADRRAYDAWLAAGNVPDAADPRPTPRYVDPSAIVSRLAPYAAEIKTFVDSNPQAWFFWQRMVGRNKPIDMDDPEFPIAWRMLAAVVGPAGGDAEKILAEVRSEAT